MWAKEKVQVIRQKLHEGELLEQSESGNWLQKNPRTVKTVKGGGIISQGNQKIP
jgi:hypothetical protein